MPEATHPSIRTNIVREYLSGKCLQDISHEQGVPYRTVRRLSKLYREGGWDNLVPRYRQCGKSKAERSYRMRRICCWLKRKHPQWGAPFIRTILTERYPGVPLPCARTMQYWFHSASLDTGPASLPLPKPENPKPRFPHQKWEVDAKENIVLGDGSLACYLTMADVASGAFLEGVVFPPLENEPGKPQRSPGKARSGLSALGHAVVNQCGQRQTAWRPAAKKHPRVCDVVNRNQHQGHLEPPQAPNRQPPGGTHATYQRQLGRSRTVLQPG